MKQLLWLLFLPYPLSAGFLSWFYTSPNQVTQFECPYHCGDWGTEGVRRVEWKAILAMWELDRFGHAIQDNPFPYHEIPKSMDDPWFLKFKTAGVSLENRIVAKAISNPANNRFLPSMIDELEFSTGVVKGLTLSAGESIADFVPSAMSSLSGLSHGIIGFALSPEEVSRDFYHACQNVIEVIKENGLTETLKPFFPEIQELNNSHTLSYSRQGELVGHLVGKFGFEILLIRTGVKGVTAYRDLRKANAVLTLKKISTSAQAEQLITMHAKEWWSKTAPIINELKMTKSAKLDIELFKVFRNQSLSEVQVRRILHHAGFKTFPRPKGIPESWNVSLSKKHGGMVYNHPGNPHIKIRVSPGIPESRNPVQRKPYVIHKTDKGLFDKKGNICKRDSAETHIPLNEYDFRKFSIRETIDE